MKKLTWKLFWGLMVIFGDIMYVQATSSLLLNIDSAYCSSVLLYLYRFIRETKSPLTTAFFNPGHQWPQRKQHRCVSVCARVCVSKQLLLMCWCFWQIWRFQNRISPNTLEMKYLQKVPNLNMLTSVSGFKGAM